MISIIDILENSREIAKYLEVNFHAMKSTNRLYHRFVLVHSLCMYAVELDTIYHSLILYHIEKLGWSGEIDTGSVGSIKTHEDLARWLRDNLVGKIITLKRYGKNNDFIS